MGYCSSFELKADPWPEGLSEAIKAHDEISYAIDPDGRSSDSSKWYEWYNDLAEFSSRFPGSLLTVRREGESAGDIEVGYFLDGKYQLEQAVFTIAEFNPTKLQTPTKKGGK